MKKVEFKRIDLMSVFKLFAGMSFIIGFVIALFGGGFGNEQLRYQLETVPFIGKMLTGFFGAILFGVASALLNGLCSVIGAVLYNIFAMILGGVQVEIDEGS